MRLTRLVLALVLAGLACPALAEEPPSDAATIDALLRSEAPKSVAWGAHLAGREGVQDAVPELLRFLHPAPERLEADPDWHLAYRAVLDALIRLDAEVPSALLDGTFPKELHAGTMILILRARRPLENRAALETLFGRDVASGRPLGLDAVAAGNLLAAARAPGFAARILPAIRTELVLTVHDTDDFTLRGGHADLFAGRGDAIRGQPEGYPPYAYYRLVLDEDRRLPVVADGPQVVRYQRTERAGTRFGFGGAVPRYHLADLARGWIAAMVEIAEDDVGLPERASGIHRWSTPDAYLAWATARRDTLRRRHAEIVAELLERKAVTKEEAAVLRPQVAVEIRDERKLDTTPLPSLPELTPSEG